MIGLCAYILIKINCAKSSIFRSPKQLDNTPMLLTFQQILVANPFIESFCKHVICLSLQTRITTKVQILIHAKYRHFCRNYFAFFLKFTCSVCLTLYCVVFCQKSRNCCRRRNIFRGHLINNLLCFFLFLDRYYF